MTPSHFGALLLVLAMAGKAQTRTTPAADLVEQQVMTSSNETRVESNAKVCKDNTNNNSIENENHLCLEDIGNGVALPVNISSLKSVVQDWSSVCQELCGAGLGGAPCASHCQSSDTPSFLPAFSNKKFEICHDLCRLQLGDISCNCKNVTSPDISNPTNFTDYSHNLVCSSFCEHSFATLAGCSDCTNGLKWAILKFGGNEVPTTTPNWNEWCRVLCATGDGGSLCSCNLVPFGRNETPQRGTMIRTNAGEE